MDRWKLVRTPEFPRAEGSLAVGQGHAGQGAVLEYRFTCEAGCGGAVVALWSPAKPIAVKKKAAVSLWIRALPEVKTTLLVMDKGEETRRYPFEATSLELPGGGAWRQLVIPLQAKSTGYWDEDHKGAAKGRAIAIGILVEPRYPLAMRGNVGFDDVRLLELPDQSFALQKDMPLVPAPPGSAHLAPRLGVNIHILGEERLLDLARDAGFSFVRADMLWRQVERNGRYRFGVFDRLLSALEARGMKALWILDYGHPQHGGDPPRSADDVTAFARYAQAAAAHFKGRDVRWEIWNEPNTERFWPPAQNAVEYATLLREASRAIHLANPDALVASGGLARMDLPFLDETIAAGDAADLNAVGVHPYRKAGPEGVAPELALLANLLARKTVAKLDIWDTEWGYASYDYFSKNLRGDGHSVAGRKRQAVLACREALTVWALGLPLAVWYDLRDDGNDPRNPEHNYGLLDAANSDKPAMRAIRELTHIDRDHIYVGMVRDVPDGVHAVRLDGSAEKIFAVWSEQPDSHITMRFPTADLISATNLLGEPLNLKGGQGQTEIELVETEGPVYLKFRSK